MSDVGRNNGGASATPARAMQLLEAGQFDEAEAICRQIVATQPDNAEALNLLGLAVYQSGRAEEGLELIREGVAASPDNAALQGNLGFALMGLGRVDDAVACYRRALEIDPRDQNALGNLGQALEDLERPREAEQVYRQALEHFPGHPGALIALGNVLSTQGEFDQAIGHFREALAADPDNPAAVGNLGNALQEQGKLDEAIECYHRAIALDPQYADAHVNLGHALKEQGDMAASAAAFRRAVEADSDDADAQFNLGQLLLGTGELDAAAGHLETALAMDPGLLRAYWALEECHLKKNQPAEAIRVCEDSFRAFPENQLSIANKAFAHLLLGEEDKFDYLYPLDRFPHPTMLALPDGYADIGALNRALVRDILEHPSLKWQHEDYKTTDRGFAYGIQENPTESIRAFEAGLRRSVDAFIAELDVDPDHPFFGRAPDEYEFLMWATVLESGGWHRSHSHEEAWLSGVYHPQLCDPGPGSESQPGEPSREGWLRLDGFTQFPGADRFAHKVVFGQPEEGKLFLFPSYFLHTTIPFVGDSKRLSIAFDVQPFNWSRAPGGSSRGRG